MMIAPNVLIAEFGDAARKAAIRGWPCSLRFEQRPAPHDKRSCRRVMGLFMRSPSVRLTAPPLHAARARSSKSARSDLATGDASPAHTTTRRLQRSLPSPRACSPTRSCGHGWASTASKRRPQKSGCSTISTASISSCREIALKSAPRSQGRALVGQRADFFPDCCERLYHRGSQVIPCASPVIAELGKSESGSCLFRAGVRGVVLLACAKSRLVSVRFRLSKCECGPDCRGRAALAGLPGLRRLRGACLPVCWLGVERGARALSDSLEPYLFRPAVATSPFTPCLAGGGRAPFSSLPPDSCLVCADRRAGQGSRDAIAKRRRRRP